MLNIQSFTFNPFQENTYLLINEHRQCWIIDPGMYHQEEITEMLTYIKDNRLQPVGIINTHTHIDHIFGVQRLMDTYKLPFGIHELETPVLNGAASAAMMFSFNFKEAPQPTFYIKENTPLMLNDDVLEVRLTPGHSPGSVSFYYAPGQWVIGGDVLFAGSIGRTDLPGGNHEALLNSIRTQIFTLPDNTTVFSGHGPTTTIGGEKQYNPFLQ